MVIRLALVFLLFAFAVPASAQNVEIVGYVHNAGNKPIAGANLVIKDTSQGTVTNSEGNFSLRVQEGTLTLLFATMDHKILKKTIDVKNGFRYRLDITLAKETTLRASTCSLKEEALETP